MKRSIFTMFLIAGAMLAAFVFSNTGTVVAGPGDQTSVSGRDDRARTVSTVTAVDTTRADATINKTRIPEAVGAMILNERHRSFEPVNELAGFRSQMFKPKVASLTQCALTKAYKGIGYNHFARADI